MSSKNLASEGSKTGLARDLFQMRGTEHECVQPADGVADQDDSFCSPAC